MLTVACGAAIHLRRAWGCDSSSEANLVLCRTFTGSIGIITNFITDGPAVRDILSRLGESTAPSIEADDRASGSGCSANAPSHDSPWTGWANLVPNACSMRSPSPVHAATLCCR